ncbi:hypothetical protein [Arthrobacter sp. NPDC056493]|uniref:hypothetical protein n=1 Tax=Arthrobacter sp. NPDC056493 TaxID=3345839 RepID=UPI00366A91C4
MIKTGKNNTEVPAGKGGQTGNSLGLSAIQVIAGGAAAAVAAVIGGHLGLAGTVVGAFVLSVISAVALPLFRASLEKSHEQIMRVLPRRATDTGRTTGPQIHMETARGRKTGMAIAGTAIMFLLGVGSILGIQSATGLALSSGTSTLQSGIFHVVSSAKDTNVAPATKPTPSAPVVEPATVPTDSTTDPATDPAQQPTPAPTETDDPAPSAETTAPATSDSPEPSSPADPTGGASDAGSGAGGTGSQTQPSAGLSDGAAPAK